MSASEEFAIDMRELHELLLAEETLETALRRVGDLAVATVPACDSCGVTLTENGKISTRVATDLLANTVDDIQYGVDEGPCLDAVRTGKALRVDDTAADPRWPAFLPQAAREGVAASFSQPLMVGDKVVGALNLYSRSGSFGETDERMIHAFTRQAAVVLANAATFKRTRDLVDQLNQALESRDLIGQAKGILMAREGIDAETAFERLKAQSQSRNMKLRDIARQVVRSLPVPDRPLPAEPRPW